MYDLKAEVDFKVVDLIADSFVAGQEHSTAASNAATGRLGR
jgi:hypothetical protein